MIPDLEVVDFIPTTGWRAIWRVDGKNEESPIAGWLGMEYPAESRRERRYVAAVPDGAELVPIHMLDNLVGILGPGEDVSLISDEEVAS